MQVARDRHEHEGVQNEIVKIENPGGEAQRDDSVMNRAYRTLAYQRHAVVYGGGLQRCHRVHGYRTPAPRRDKIATARGHDVMVGYHLDFRPGIQAESLG